jgi:hypothetical protein
MEILHNVCKNFFLSKGKIIFKFSRSMDCRQNDISITDKMFDSLEELESDKKNI